MLYDKNNNKKKKKKKNCDCGIKCQETYATKPPRKATGPPPIRRILRWQESKRDVRDDGGVWDVGDMEDVHRKRLVWLTTNWRPPQTTWSRCYKYDGAWWHNRFCLFHSLTHSFTLSSNTKSILQYQFNMIFYHSTIDFQ